MTSELGWHNILEAAQHYFVSLPPLLFKLFLFYQYLENKEPHKGFSTKYFKISFPLLTLDFLEMVKLSGAPKKHIFWSHKQARKLFNLFLWKLWNYMVTLYILSGQLNKYRASLLRDMYLRTLQTK